MKKLAFLIISSATFCACTNSGSNETAGTSTEATLKIKEPATLKEPVKVKSSVLNPNLASEEDLYSLGFLDAEIKKIVEGRPYLNPSEFINKLKNVASDSKFDNLKAKLFLPMNLNTTAKEDFKMIPKVGNKMAHEFEEYRPYTSISQFRREIGKYVSEEEVSRYEKYIFVPVNLNTASKAEILTIPGVGNKMLHEFEEYRPYKSIEQFRREIGKYVNEDELARLERYVTL